MADPDAPKKVIVTALPCETDAVLAHLVDVRPAAHPEGTLFDVGVLRSAPHIPVAVVAAGMGNLGAAALTERAIAHFDPDLLLFCGIAGGLKPDLELGDVVVASKTYAYQGGRSEDDDFHSRPRSWELQHAVDQVARRIKDEQWHALLPAAPGLPKPSARLAPIAAGEVLLASRTSPVARQLHHHFNDAVAVEMEGAGFAQALHFNRRVLSAVVRGISDHADRAKAGTDSRGWQHVAAANAAAYAVALVTALHRGERAERRPAEERPQLQLPTVHNTNNASGNAHVGQQNGINLSGWSK
ncbi:5'-methylthioadenosine/S-adenosylhomocysteine nucleosidase [Actinosynnema pretiosum subsp. pretiosum]|uniref:5'-methylthioadenosine/S-adenosylhomocysteine nucleosidase n=1 Tax=Actinosynnema pretiosum subsp. pretiosum TaxID=103721 RepID=A0AA45L3A8_9PSEU|nr:putative secreted nucleosidase [Actinosynnema pretiosum subsp. pretiosum]QUF02709.1 5'-methylthioadenosine/S-adenosylhomocysteine nucleosidase [Actinosynnema pretiosum subsp. pretiosum]